MLLFENLWNAFDEKRFTPKTITHIGLPVYTNILVDIRILNEETGRSSADL
jgi:hypothetical protein